MIVFDHFTVYYKLGAKQPKKRNGADVGLRRPQGSATNKIISLERTYWILECYGAKGSHSLLRR